MPLQVSVRRVRNSAPALVQPDAVLQACHSPCLLESHHDRLDLENPHVVPADEFDLVAHNSDLGRRFVMDIRLAEGSQV